MCRHGKRQHPSPCVYLGVGEVGGTVCTAQPALPGSVYTPHGGPPLGYPSDLRVHTLVDAVHPQDSGPEEEAHTGSGHKLRAVWAGNFRVPGASGCVGLCILLP